MIKMLLIPFFSAAFTFLFFLILYFINALSHCFRGRFYRDAKDVWSHI